MEAMTGVSARRATRRPAPSHVQPGQDHDGSAEAAAARPRAPSVALGRRLLARGLPARLHLEGALRGRPWGRRKTRGLTVSAHHRCGRRGSSGSAVHVRR